MKAQQQDGQAVIDQAIEWIERLRVGDAESEAFFDWLTESPRHVEVFMQAMTLEQRISAIAPEDWAAAEAAAGESSVAEIEPANVVPLRNVVSLSSPILSQARIKRPKWWLAAAAAGIAVLAIAGWQLAPRLDGWQDFTTTVGEQRIVQLEDGSLLTLNTGTHVEVRMSAQARDMRLLEGEALFNVHRDVARPFRVHVRDAVIQALGTQFNVYRRGTETTVSVLEGRVRVASASAKDTVARVEPAASSSAATLVEETSPNALSAGEQADIGHDGELKRRTKVMPARATAWQQRRLIFDEEPLANIVFEFNRYNHRQLHVEDAVTGLRRFSGIFNADDPDSLAQLLARDTRLAVERGGRKIVIKAR